MADQLPHNDPDLSLAREIKKLREQGQPLSKLDDKLIQQLLDYKRNKNKHSDIRVSGKEKVWDEIRSATEPNQKAKVTYLFKSPAVRWAAAAILIIGGIFSFIYFGLNRQPGIVAQSFASIKTVHINNGGTVTLRPHSTLYNVKKSYSKVVYKLKGEAQFEVTHNPARTFAVKTNKGIITDLGTKFIVRTWGKQTKVYLQHGSVKVKANKSNQSVVLSPGQSASITAKSHIKVDKKANVAPFTDWLNQQLIFNDKPVSRVVSELEQQFDISISLPDSIAKQQISGQLSLKSLQSALNDLGLALNGSFVQTGKNSYKFEATPQ
jgi:ferric-dicitrate binding protein FerR (iron transport regulator)